MDLVNDFHATISQSGWRAWWQVRYAPWGSIPLAHLAIVANMLSKQTRYARNNDRMSQSSIPFEVPA